jgi:predicted ATP-grasp superfamily ATP-dependent carboligase
MLPDEHSATVTGQARPKESVLVLGDYQQSLVVVRSLARAGYRVIVGQASRRAACALSRYAHETWSHPETSDAVAFLAALRRFLDSRADVTCVFPVGESDLSVLCGAYETLMRRVRLIMPAPAVVETCLNKPRCYEIAAGIGVPLARAALADRPETLKAHIKSIGLPVVFKCPDSSRLIDGHKAVICRQQSDLEQWQEALSESCPLIVQRWVAGARHNCHFAADNGTMTAYFQQRVLRTDEPDDTGYGVEGISVEPMDCLARHVTALVHKLGYHGVGCAQFLVDDATGEYVFLELNPRLDATCELPYRCGFDFPRLAMDPRQTTPGDYPAGRRFHWLLGDARAIMKQVRQRGARQSALGHASARILASHWRADYRLTWDWRDPLPTLYLYGQAFMAGGRRTMQATGLTAP